MQFIWAKKLTYMRAKQSATVVPYEEVLQELTIPTTVPEPEPVVVAPQVILVSEVPREVVVPEPVVEPPQEVVVDPTPETDKILVTEHKDGECLASSCKEDDAFGGGEEEVDGQEVVLPCAEVGEGDVQEGSA